MSSWLVLLALVDGGDEGAAFAVIHEVLEEGVRVDALGAFGEGLPVEGAHARVAGAHVHALVELPGPDTPVVRVVP
jgi:hypothetical protein